MIMIDTFKVVIPTVIVIIENYEHEIKSIMCC